MITRNSAQGGRLKNSILRGVYDENLRMESDRPISRPGRKLTRRKKRALTGSLLVLVSMLLVSLYLDTWDLRGPVEGNTVATSSQPVFSPPEPIEIEVQIPVPVLVPISFPVPVPLRARAPIVGSSLPGSHRGIFLD